MARNTLMDLHNILFEELERLNDESLTGDALSAEIKRARAIEGVADKVTNNTSNMLTAIKLQSKNHIAVPVAMLGSSNEA